MDQFYLNTAQPQHPITLASGQPLGPGEGGWSDMTSDDDRGLLDAGHLTQVDDPFAGLTVDQVLEQVGDSPERATAALKSEKALPAKERRKTLVEDLTRLSNPTTTEEQ